MGKATLKNKSKAKTASKDVRLQKLKNGNEVLDAKRRENIQKALDEVYPVDRIEDFYAFFFGPDIAAAGACDQCLSANDLIYLQGLIDAKNLHLYQEMKKHFALMIDGMAVLDNEIKRMKQIKKSSPAMEKLANSFLKAVVPLAKKGIKAKKTLELQVKNKRLAVMEKRGVDCTLTDHKDSLLLAIQKHVDQGHSAKQACVFVARNNSINIGKWTASTLRTELWNKHKNKSK